MMELWACILLPQQHYILHTLTIPHKHKPKRKEKGRRRIGNGIIHEKSRTEKQPTGTCCRSLLRAPTRLRLCSEDVKGEICGFTPSAAETCHVTEEPGELVEGRLKIASVHHVDDSRIKPCFLRNRGLRRGSRNFLLFRLLFSHCRRLVLAFAVFLLFGCLGLSRSWRRGWSNRGGGFRNRGSERWWGR